MTEEVILGLGSNLGDREAHLVRGLSALGKRVPVVAVSSVYESAAAIFEDQPDFLNLVVVGRTELSPRALLDFIQSVERLVGRVRSFRAAPRTLDVDILFFGDRRIDEEGLTIPHPGWRDRAFVLAPLAEVMPGRMDPERGSTVEELWRESAPRLANVRRISPPPTSSREIS